MMKKIAKVSSSLPLTSIMENSQDVWGIKDSDSRFIYTNRAFLDFLNLPQGFDVIGRRDDELPTCIAEFSLITQKLEREVIKSGQKITLIKTHFFGREQKLQPYLYETFPLHNKRSKCIGTVFYGRKLAIISLPHYVDKLTDTLLLEPPSNLFTQSELRIIFYLYWHVLIAQSKIEFVFYTKKRKCIHCETLNIFVIKPALTALFPTRLYVLGYSVLSRRFSYEQQTEQSEKTRVKR